MPVNCPACGSGNMARRRQCRKCGNHPDPAAGSRPAHVTGDRAVEAFFVVGEGE